MVRDRTIAHAIQQAYSVATIKERSPEVHLLVTLPPDRVDVNVHPTKAEVRFLDQNLVHKVLRAGRGGCARRNERARAPAGAARESFISSAVGRAAARIWPCASESNREPVNSSGGRDGSARRARLGACLAFDAGGCRARPSGSRCHT